MYTVGFMIGNRSSCSFVPGECVFLQGDVVKSFYKVTSGRFARVYTDKPVKELGVKHILNESELVGIVSHHELFGEIDALRGQPQTFSVFALDHSSVMSIPANDHEQLKDYIVTDPKIGVRACVSFARYMKRFFEHFAAVAKEEVEIDAFLRMTARDYMAGMNEVANAVRPAINDPDLLRGRSHAAYEVARLVVQQSDAGLSASLNASVSCNVLGHVSRDAKMQNFKAGTLLCKTGTLGDKLFIVVSGAAEVVTEGANPNIRIDQPGSVVGETTVFLNLDQAAPDMRRTYDVICATDVTAIVVHLHQVEEFFTRRPEIMTKMLAAMVERSETTRKLCESSEFRLKTMLFEQLGVLLEGMNSMARNLSTRHDKVNLLRPAAFYSQRARAVYNRFKTALEILEAGNRIKA